MLCRIILLTIRPIEDKLAEVTNLQFCSYKNEERHMVIAGSSVKPAKKPREIWVDNVKSIACILVVIGHFFQSMTQAGIIPVTNFYSWFDQTIYYFHVQLFFICSGYLYQKLSKVNNIESWQNNVLKKLLVLGVPYFTFSFATWCLKTLFSSSVNRQIGGLGETLFLHPTAPYWYLYALFFLFLITPTFGNKSMAWVGLIVGCAFKLFAIIWGSFGVQIIGYVISNEIWFIIGMCISVFELRKYIENIDPVTIAFTGVGFIFLSILVYVAGVESGFISFILGFVACFCVITLIQRIFANKGQAAGFGVLAKYTMPIFLMHTLFAAPMRTLLLKLGISNVVVHVCLGILISFAGPVAASIIMEKSKWLEFFVYPGKFIKIK